MQNEKPGVGVELRLCILHFAFCLLPLPGCGPLHLHVGERHYHGDQEGGKVGKRESGNVARPPPAVDDADALERGYVEEQARKLMEMDHE